MEKHFCKCGCGQECKQTWVRNHNKRGRPTGWIPTPEARKLMSLATKGIPKTPEHRLAISRAMRKGETSLRKHHKIIRGWDVYKAWRKSVFERDNYTCQICGARSKKGDAVYLEADHIVPFTLHPDLIFSVSNGRTLCLKCHRMTKTFGSRIKKDRHYKQMIVFQAPLEMIMP